MENDDIPMPRPPDRLRALLAEALVRSGRAERTADRLAGLLKDAPAMSKPGPYQAPVPGVHLYAIILNRFVDMYEVDMKLKHGFGCEKVISVCDNVWMVVARDGVHERIRTELNDMFDRHVAVLVLEIRGSHALATPPSMSDLVSLIRQYN
jgi:hypothetical protein